MEVRIKILENEVRHLVSSVDRLTDTLTKMQIQQMQPSIFYPQGPGVQYIPPLKFTCGDAAISTGRFTSNTSNLPKEGN